MRISRITFALLALLAASPAQAQFSKSTLSSQINQSFPDQNTGQITPATTRTFLNNLVNSFQQYLGVNAQVGVSYTIQASDYGQLVTFNNANPVAVSIAQTTSPFNVQIKNNGAGLVTVTPTTGTINGGASISISNGTSIWLVSDLTGTNFATITGTAPFANPTASVGLTAVNGVASTAMRSDAAPALSQAIVPTWTGAHTFSPTTGNAITINPAVNTLNRAITETITGPVSGSNAGPQAYNLINVTHTSTTTGAGSDAFGLLNTNTVGFRVNMTTGGANWAGQATTAGGFAIAITSPTVLGAPDAIGVWGVAFTNVDASASGTGLYGMNPFARVGTSGKINDLIGIESDVQIDNSTAGAVARRAGFRAINLGAFQAGTLDAAYSAGSTTAGGAFQHLMVLDQTGGFTQPALATTGDFFFSTTAFTIAHFANLTNATVTGNILGFTNVQLAGSGLLTSNANGIAANSTDRIVLQNTTAATAGVQAQWSPRIHWIGQGWKTNATAASQTVEWIAEVQATAGAAQPTSPLVFSTQINGGGYTLIAQFSLGSTGNSTLLLNSQSAKNAALQLSDNLAPVWYLINLGGSSDALQLLNSDANGNAQALRVFQSTGVHIGTSTTDPGTGILSVLNAVQSPLIKGGTAASSTLTIESTSGAGTTDAIIFQTASQSIRARITTGGLVNIGTDTASPAFLLNVTKNTSALPSNPAAVGSQIVAAIAQADGVGNRLGIFSAGTGVFSSIAYFTSRNTLASPTATQNNDALGGNFWFGFGATVYSAGAGFLASACQNWTDAANCAFLDIYTAATGALTTNGFRFQGSGGFSIGGALTDPGAGGLFVNGATITFNGLATDATHTDRTVCQDTTSKSLFFGSGAAGICLGTSSAAFKHDIAKLAAGLDQIMGLEAVSYKLNADHGDPDRTLYGFTAEQGANVLPDLVGLDSRGYPQTFDYMGVVPVLVRAVQQLKADNDNLRSTIRKLGASR